MNIRRDSGASLSRRQFLRLWAPAVAGLTLVNDKALHVAAAAEAEATDVPAMLLDISRCVGCGACQRACGKANALPACPDPYSGLSADTYTFVDECQVASGETRFVKRACMHCLNPGCASACPVGALHKTPEGPIVADTSKCIGCRYCQYACPFGVPKFEWENTLGVMRKCSSCIERLAQGQIPACAAACPSGAIKAGWRSDLLTEAHARIAADGDRYVDHVYGETEAGGTARLYLSDVPFEEVGLPSLDAMPVPHYAEQVMTRTPVIAAGVALFSTAAYTFLKRREKGMNTEMSHREESQQ